MRYLVTLTLLISLVFAPLGVSKVAEAQFNPIEETCDSIPDTDQRSDSIVCNDSEVDENPVTGTDGVILIVANVLSIIAAIIAVIIIIVAGITMSTSSGDSQKIQNSRNAIIYAVVGIVVVVLARSIVIFVINQTG